LDNEIDRKIDVTAILFLLVQNRLGIHEFTLPLKYFFVILFVVLFSTTSQIFRFDSDCNGHSIGSQSINQSGKLIYYFEKLNLLKSRKFRLF